MILVVAAPGLKGTGSAATMYGLSCSEACGIFLDQGLNQCLLHWQVDGFFTTEASGKPYPYV